MSLVKTLAKVAVGVAIAKGVNDVAKSRSGKGSILEGLKRQAGALGGGGSRGGLEGMLGQVLSGRGAGTGAAGGLGGLLESLGGKPAPQTNSAPRRGSLGDLLNQSFERYGEPEIPPDAREEQEAALLLKAMIMAVKADGRIDAGEKDRLMAHLDDANDEEMSFIEEHLSAPVDPQALAAETPEGMEAKLYLMSIMAIDIDSAAEERYLRDLAGALDLDRATVEAIHERLGVPAPS